MPSALLSVSDKKGIVELARGLASRGFTLVSTGGTAQVLSAAGLQVTSVAEVTGFPEMLDGRVKTLHPAIHAGVLARRDRPDDLAAIESQGIGLIDVVVVNLYPFEKAAGNAETPFEALVEEIDVGGPSLVRAAAKNFRHTLVVVDPADYARVLAALDETPTLAFRFEMARKAFAATAAFDAMVVRSLGRFVAGDTQLTRRPADHEPDSYDFSIEKIQQLRYGENPHQRATWYRAPGLDAGAAPNWGFGHATLLQGKDLSFTNLLDLDAAARIVREFDAPAAAVIKHTNPCGVAIGSTMAEAYVRAREADRLSSFGGIVALNGVLDIATAQAITSTKIDCVIAPAVADEAREILKRKSNMRVVIADFTAATSGALELRSILGALLVQERDDVVEARTVWTLGTLPEGFRVVSQRPPTTDEWGALRFSWQVCAHVKSNSVVFAGPEQTLAVGAGQMSRVDAVRVAVMTTRAPHGLVGSVAATDGFFPFRDGVDAVAAAGATAVIHPGGSLRDEEVIAAADEHGLAMVFTGRRHFRH
ncbi:MAG: bifunctional phosphoribosylaminoimidazolecarboxamide formyltransferase/IMP cyclohydrolase [Acidobacteriota bacterium]